MKRNDVVLMKDSKRKLKELFDRIKESKKESLSINCKKLKCMAVSKRGSPSCELYIGYVRIEQVQKVNFLGITSKRKCGTEI